MRSLILAAGASAAVVFAIALFCVLGGIFLSLVTNAPVSVFVTSLSFACYLVARFVAGPRRRELRAVRAGAGDEGRPAAIAAR